MMTDFTEHLRSEMLQRIGELKPYEAELDRLRAALDRLDGGEGQSRDRDVEPLPPETVAVMEGVRGVRQRQALALVAQHPGITAQEIADRLGLDSGILYAPVRRLVASGHIVKRDRGLYLP